MVGGDFRWPSDYRLAARGWKTLTYTTDWPCDIELGLSDRDSIRTAHAAGVDALFVGGSLLHTPSLDDYLRALHRLTRLPLIGFPGFAGYYSKDAIILAVENAQVFGSGYARYSPLTSKPSRSRRVMKFTTPAIASEP